MNNDSVSFDIMVSYSTKHYLYSIAIYIYIYTHTYLDMK